MVHLVIVNFCLQHQKIIIIGQSSLKLCSYERVQFFDSQCIMCFHYEVFNLTKSVMM